jgi:hypothetical protein
MKSYKYIKNHLKVLEKKLKIFLKNTKHTTL